MDQGTARRTSLHAGIIKDNYRICIGRHIANAALFIDIACILWASNISAVKDEAGNPIIPDTLETVNDGFVV